MSSHYNLRKRQPSMVFTEDSFDLESLLADHEHEGTVSRMNQGTKKRRIETDSWADHTIPLDSLPALCIERIYSLLESPRDLYNLSFSSKYLMSLVTPEIVVRSAVFNNLRRRDVRHRKIMSSIISYLSNQSIHVPSAHRLLRLLNAKVCERGDQCWGKDLVTGKSAVLDPAICSRPFGLAICDTCVKFGTTNVPYSHFSRFQRGVAFFQWNKVMDPIIDSVTGEVHGPLVRAIQLQQIECSYKSAEDRKIALQTVANDAHRENGRETPITYEEKAIAFVDMFEVAENEADKFVEEVNRREYQQYRERRQNRIAKRLRRIKLIYRTLDSLLSDCSMRDLALNCTWYENDKDCLKFSCTIVDHIMKNIVNAPASATDKVINDAATRIREVFTILNDKKFFTFSFVAESTNRFRQGVYEYCRNEITPFKLMSSPYADLSFLRQVETNQPTKALIRVLNMIQGAMPRCFALSVVRMNTNGENDNSRIDDYRRLAEAVWKRKSSTGPVWSFATIKGSYNTCQEEFRVVKKAAKEYLIAPQTRAFLRREVPNAYQVENFTRQDALNQVFSPSTCSSYFMTLNERVNPYELLLHRNFQTLRDVHEAYFRWPQRYGLINEG